MTGTKSQFADAINKHSILDKPISHRAEFIYTKSSEYNEFAGLVFVYLFAFHGSRSTADSDNLTEYYADIADNKTVRRFDAFSFSLGKALSEYQPGHESHASFLTFLTDIMNLKIKEIQREDEKNITGTGRPDPYTVQSVRCYLEREFKQRPDAVDIEKIAREYGLTRKQLQRYFEISNARNMIYLQDNPEEDGSSEDDIFPPVTDYYALFDEETPLFEKVEAAFCSLTPSAKNIVSKILANKVFERYPEDSEEIVHVCQNKHFSFLDVNFFNEIRAGGALTNRDLAKRLSTSPPNITQVYKRFIIKLKNGSEF